MVVADVQLVTAEKGGVIKGAAGGIEPQDKGVGAGVGMGGVPQVPPPNVLSKAPGVVGKLLEPCRPVTAGAAGAVQRQSDDRYH